MLLDTYTEDPVATISTSVMLLYVAYIWIQGIIGMICTNSIKRTYGGVISKGWALMRMVRILCNAAMSGVISRISLIFTVFSLGTIFVLTDTSDYVRDKAGNIYRIRDDLDL